MSSLSKIFLLPLSPRCLEALSLYFPTSVWTGCSITSLYPYHIQENQPRFIMGRVNLQGNLLTCLPETLLGPRGRGGGRVPFLLFYIYVLRFQDTWKGFAPSLLIGYKPWGSLLTHVPDESPRQAVFLLHWGWSPRLDVSWHRGRCIQSPNVGEDGLSQRWGSGL